MRGLEPRTEDHRPRTKNKEPRISAPLPRLIIASQDINPAGPDAGRPSVPQAPSSYGQILRSSSIIGGAQAISYLIRMVRTKLVAVLLGPSGVGLVGLYESATGLVGALTSLGISASGVRDVAEAHAGQDPVRMASTVKTLRRACWVTGLFGWLATLALARPLSVWTFGSAERAGAIALLGVTLLLSAISGGQGSVLQGTRRIGDMARAGVLGTLGGTAAAVALYAWLGERGIVPVMIASAAINLGISWWYARRISLDPVEQTWRESFRNAKRLAGLGLALVWSGLLNSGLALGIRGLIVRDLGLESNGIYQSAWAISGMFAGFIVAAMGTDFYPRLSAVSRDNGAVNRLVNEQTEIGILLALPGLLGTLAFAPLLMHFFYTEKFLPGAELLPWFVLGLFGRIVSWPLGYIQLAKRVTGWFAVTEAAYAAAHYGLAVAFLHWLKLPGVAVAFAVLYVGYTAGMLAVSARLSGFRWSGAVIKLLLGAAVLVALGFALSQGLSGISGAVMGGLITGLAGVLCLRGLAQRLGPEHRMVRWAGRFPGGSFVLG